MKKILTLFVFAVALTVSARASIGQVKNLSATGSSVIMIPGSDDQIYTIQNNGANSVRLSYDGGAGYFSVNGGKAGTNPDPTHGYLLAAGAQVTFSTVPYGSSSMPNLHKPIVAIMVTGTTTLDIISDGVNTQYPTT